MYFRDPKLNCKMDSRKIQINKIIWIIVYYLVNKKGKNTCKILLNTKINAICGLMKITRQRPLPSCPAARKTFGKLGTGPMTGFPSGTERSNFLLMLFSYKCSSGNRPSRHNVTRCYTRPRKKIELTIRAVSYSYLVYFIIKRL